MPVPTHELHRTIDAVWRTESPRIIALVARMVRDVGLAESLAQDAVVSALETWPASGLPDNPAAWLMTTAKHRALDHLRQAALHLRKQQELGADADARGDHVVHDFSDTLDDKDAFDDDMLRLIFTACHPLLSIESQVALTLKLLAGLRTDEIARAYVVPKATMAQRIVRAKRTLSDANVPYEVPQGEALDERLASVMEVVYLIYNEGYSATAGEDLMRPALCGEALRLARMLATLVPLEPEVHGLVALMEIQSSRATARVNAEGEPIVLMMQDRSRWDRSMIERGLAALDQADQLGRIVGPYQLQASIAACHARARTPEQTDWRTIVSLYDMLLGQTPSAIVALNRAVAVGMAQGPDAALVLVDAVVKEGALSRYHLLSAVRGDLLIKVGRQAEGRIELERAATLTQNERERALLRTRARSTLG